MRMIKKYTAFFALVIFIGCFAMIGPTVAADGKETIFNIGPQIIVNKNSSNEPEPKRDITISVEGAYLPVQDNAKPYIQAGTTMVPFRVIFESLNLSVNWDGKTQKVTGTKEGLIIELTVGQKFAIVNGKKISLTLAPKLTKGVTFVPLRFVGEASGATVTWHAANNYIEIVTSVEQNTGNYYSRVSNASRKSISIATLIGDSYEHSTFKDVPIAQVTANMTAADVYALLGEPLERSDLGMYEYTGGTVAYKYDHALIELGVEPNPDNKVEGIILEIGALDEKLMVKQFKDLFGLKEEDITVGTSKDGSKMYVAPAVEGKDFRIIVSAVSSSEDVDSITQILIVFG